MKKTAQQKKANKSVRQTDHDVYGRVEEWLEPVEGFVKPALLQNGTVSDEYVASFESYYGKTDRNKKQ
ncbi:MAG: hypothetical protein KatS3mg100_001 [Candidatus Parcubacteria bacterium]|nr:MAG: hypothetical protein KatS3mg100_001 [Candidatus Parcubacteria bacterium]